MATENLCAIAPTLAVSDGVPTTTSFAVAQYFGKRHKNVLRDVQTLIEQMPPEHLLNFEQVFISSEGANGAVRQMPAYRITRTGFTLLAMSFTGPKALRFKLAYIEAFDRMERELATRQKPALVEPRLSGAPKLQAQIQQLVNQRAWTIAGDCIEHVREWLTHYVATKCVHPDGSPRACFDASLASAEFNAFLSDWQCRDLSNSLVILDFLHKETGAIKDKVAQLVQGGTGWTR